MDRPTRELVVTGNCFPHIAGRWEDSWSHLGREERLLERFAKDLWSKLTLERACRPDYPPRRRRVEHCRVQCVIVRVSIGLIFRKG
jgi:hypothetical protein